jgi:hypothetical protein
MLLLRVGITRVVLRITRIVILLEVILVLGLRVLRVR